MEADTTRVPLALLPTPLVPLPRLTAALRVPDGAPLELWCKRDDLTGSSLSGNKVRKLEHLFAEAEAAGATVILTTGGIQSNHARATAVAARERGMDIVLLLRGEPTPDPDGNLLLDIVLGARIVWCNAEEYRISRDDILRTLAAEVAATGAVPYIIPEGGSNRTGARGYIEAAAEIAAVGRHFDHVVVACGSGGTVAGLALGADIGFIHGIAVCDDREYFRRRVREIAGDGVREPGDGWDILEGYQGPAYGVATSAVWDTIRLAACTEGLLLDPVYTGKALHALRTEVTAGRWGGRILFWHTGGIYGLFGRGREALAE